MVHVEVGKHFGTAFLTNLSERSGLFLTAYHVISPAVHGKLPIKLRRGNSRGFAAKIVDINRERDLALLSAKVPANVHLRSFAIAPVHDVGRLTVLQMLNPDQGIIAPLFVSVPFAGETAVEMEVDGELVTIDRVWSQQGLQIAGGVSGAPVVSELDDAIVAVACAGADRLDQAFFVPLISAQVGARKRNGKMIADSIIKAQESIRLGRYPNGRGIALRCWLKTRESVRSLAVSGVYDRAHAIDRPSLGSALKLFMSSDKPVSILAGESGVGKSTSVAKLVQTIKCERPVLLMRAAQIPSGRESLKSALCDALKISDASTFDKVPAIAGPAPLIVLDGINEVTIARHEWPGFTRSQLAQFGDMVGRKGWKLLITTRVDRLEDITEIKHILGNKLFDPMPKPERSQLPPYIRLGSFDRDEFSELLRIYELPPSLPFPELRHPIVFRLAAEASVTDHGTGIRVRDLFAQYFSEIVTKIHFRCEGKNRDRIRELIEQWASTNSLRNSGRLSYEDLGESADEAIAEAGVAEGLFERVPGGYRFVYDEVYDYVRAGRLAQELDRQIRTAHEPSIALLKTARANGATFGSLARALELLADRFPETCERFADALADELAADAASMPPPASSDISTTDPQFKLSIAALSRLALEPVRTLSLVEKGGPFDRAKQYLPLLTSSGSLGAWGVHSHFPFMVSDDHLSYAFSEESMWRMIRLTAASRGRDSFPWRAKDVADDLAHEAARDALETTEHFKVVRHFVTGFPNEAFEKLSQGLAETERIGSEHSFGSFCAQVLAVYSDRYELTKLLKIVPQPMFYALFERLAKHHADKILDVFFDEKIGFVARPHQAAQCLAQILSENPNMAARMAAIAGTLILIHKHPVHYYSAFMPWLAKSAERRKFTVLMEAAWTSGTATSIQLTDFVRAGFVSFSRAIELCRERVRHAGLDAYDILYDFVLSINGRYLRNLPRKKQIEGVDKIICALLEQPNVDPDCLAKCTEPLLYTAFNAGALSKRLLPFIAEVCRKAPARGLEHIGYPLATSYFTKLGIDEQKRFCEIMISNLPKDYAVRFAIRSLKFEKADVASFSVSLYAGKFGSDLLFEGAQSIACSLKEMNYGSEKEFKLLVQLLEAIDPERYLQQCKSLDV